MTCFVSERKENTEGIERLDYCKVCCNFKPSNMLAGNVHKTPKQGERKGQMDRVGEETLPVCWRVPFRYRAPG